MISLPFGVKSQMKGKSSFTGCGCMRYWVGPKHMVSVGFAKTGTAQFVLDVENCHDQRAQICDRATRSKLEMKKARFRKITIASVCLIISICLSLSIILSVLKLPQLSQPGIITTNSADKPSVIGKFGKMMIDMLPGDLAFTVFLPSEEAFGQVLKLKVNESLKGERLNDTLAILSRLLGFSAVPRAIYSADVPLGREMDFDSLSGFRLSVWKEEDGRLLVNRISSKSEDHKVRETLVHVMDGVIMDADFEQSFLEEDDEED